MPYISREEYVKYALYCETEAATVNTDWIATTAGIPTTCPNDRTHTIDTARTSVVDVQDSNEIGMKIALSNDASIKNYSKIFSIAFTATASTTTTNTYTVVYPMALILISMQPVTGQMGDHVTLCIYPAASTGTLTADAAIGDTTFHASTSAFDEVFTGYHLSISDGVNTDDVELVKDVDVVAGTITTNVATTHAFTAGATLTAHIAILENVQIGPPGLLIGASRDHSMTMVLNAGDTLVTTYENSTGVDKGVLLQLQVLY